MTPLPVAVWWLAIAVPSWLIVVNSLVGLVTLLVVALALLTR